MTITVKRAQTKNALMAKIYEGSKLASTLVLDGAGYSSLSATKQAAYVLSREVSGYWDDPATSKLKLDTLLLSGTSEWAFAMRALVENADDEALSKLVKF